MIQSESIINVSDNTGVKKVLCIRVLGGSKKRIANLGDIIICSARDTISTSKIKKGSVVRAVLVRVNIKIGRRDGTYVKFDENSVVLINKENEPIGTRIFGPVAREIKSLNFSKIVSLAQEII